MSTNLAFFSSYFPKKIETNADILKKMNLDMSDVLLYRTVGSKEKRVCTSGESGSVMMAEVGKKILDQAQITSKEIDKLICCCDPPDQAAPDSSVITHMKLGLSCASFAVSMSCVGWLSAVNIGLGFAEKGDKNVLVLASSTVGSTIKFNSPMHRAIFGDGAGGVLIQSNGKAAGAKVLSIDLMTIGQFYKDIYAPMPWSDVPDLIPEKFKDSFYMANDNQLFFSALDKYIKPFYLRQYEKNNISPERISRFIVHQASMPIFNHTVKSFGIPIEKTADYFALYGNTISAELPIITDLELKSGRIKKGDLVYYLTYGAGFTAGAMVVQF